MKATFVLTPAEARRLIAKAVIQTPEFQKAWKDAYVLLAGGTTNAFIAQELGCEVETDLDALCARDDVDAVIVATPNYLHKEPVLAAARHKKQIGRAHV